jgi:hypothetical protein
MFWDSFLFFSIFDQKGECILQEMFPYERTETVAGVYTILLSIEIGDSSYF